MLPEWRLPGPFEAKDGMLNRSLAKFREFLAATLECHGEACAEAPSIPPPKQLLKASPLMALNTLFTFRPRA